MSKSKEVEVNDEKFIVNYEVSGQYYPATLEDPEEWPEIEVISIEDIYGKDVTEDLSPETYDKIVGCVNYYEDEDEE